MRSLGGAKAESGHLEVLRWAREHDCPVDWTTCALAAKGGHMEVLRWAREHGCPWSSNTWFSRYKRAPGGAEVGARARLPVE
jgi:hypothetical protein